MTLNTLLARTLVIAVGVPAMIASAAAAAALVGHGFIEGVLVASILGGLIVAYVLHWGSAPSAPSMFVADPFARDVFSRDTLNVSQIRVAGIGGFGLVIAAAVVVFQYELLIAAMTMGVLGGMLCGFALIRYRRAASLRPRSPLEHLN